LGLYCSLLDTLDEFQIDAVVDEEATQLRELDSNVQIPAAVRMDFDPHSKWLIWANQSCCMDGVFMFMYKVYLADHRFQSKLGTFKNKFDLFFPLFENIALGNSTATQLVSQKETILLSLRLHLNLPTQGLELWNDSDTFLNCLFNPLNLEEVERVFLVTKRYCPNHLRSSTTITNYFKNEYSETIDSTLLTAEKMRNFHLLTCHDGRSSNRRCQNSNNPCQNQCVKLPEYALFKKECADQQAYHQIPLSYQVEDQVYDLVWLQKFINGNHFVSFIKCGNRIACYDSFKLKPGVETIVYQSHFPSEVRAPSFIGYKKRIQIRKKLRHLSSDSECDLNPVFNENPLANSNDDNENALENVSDISSIEGRSEDDTNVILEGAGFDSFLEIGMKIKSSTTSIRMPCTDF
jgi:hypothetical protein